jgi:hypothetical protein
LNELLQKLFSVERKLKSITSEAENEQALPTEFKHERKGWTTFDCKKNGVSGST